MKIYRLTFVKNEVMSCKEAENTVVFNGVYHYEISKEGNLIYAIIKAENEENALTMANFIIKECRNKVITA